MLMVTSGLLLALAPEPMRPDQSTALLAVDDRDSLESIFNTPMRAPADRWKYVYIHHSKTPAGDIRSLSGGSGWGGHFVIGNGNAAGNGEIQVSRRWDMQASADAPAGASSLDPAAISICLIGDFDRTVPTPAQLERLTQLTAALQSRFNIPASHVIMVEQRDLVAGIGKYFPADAFRERITR